MAARRRLTGAARPLKRGPTALRDWRNQGGRPPGSASSRRPPLAWAFPRDSKEIALANAPLSAPAAADRATPRRALISVFDKTGLVDIARALSDLGVELISTGGTRAAIAAAGLPVADVATLTGYPEMMDGRVKTLHPVVHGGLLGVRDAPEHAKAMAEHGIGGIDLLYVNLYPFEAAVA